MKRLITAVYTEEEKEKIFNEYKNSKQFGKRQLNVIYNALNNLTKEQIDLFAKPNMNYKDMNRIRRYFNVLRDEDIRFLLNSNFSSEQMSIVMDALVEGIPKEKLDLFAKPEFTYHQMVLIKSAIDDGYNMEQLKLISNPNMDPYEMLLIKMDINDGLSIEDIKDKECIAVKRLIRKSKIFGLNDEQNKFVEECKNSGKFNEKQIHEIIYGFHHDLTMDEVKVYADPNFTEEQMGDLEYAFEDGLNVEQVKIMADPRFNFEQMHNIYLALMRKLPVDFVKSFARPDVHEKIMSNILRDYDKNLSLDEIKEKYNNKYDYKIFANKRNNLYKLAEKIIK